MKDSNYFWPLLLVLLLVTTGLTTSASSLEIVMEEELRVERRDIFLGQVALIEGQDQELMDEVAALWLGSSPPPGIERTISRQTILLRLKNEGFDLSELELIAPSRMTISTHYKPLSSEQLEQKLMDYLQQELDGLPLEELVVSHQQAGNQILVPAGELELKLRTLSDDVLSYLGDNTIPMEVMIDGERWRQIYPRFTVQARTMVPVLNTSLARHQQLQEGMFDWQTKDLARLSVSPFLEEEELLGLRARRNLNEGTVLGPDLMEKPPLVERGDQVQLLVVHGMIRVSVMGEARESGVYGDLIRVRNNDSGEILQARVIGESLVQIDTDS